MPTHIVQTSAECLLCQALGDQLSPDLLRVLRLRLARVFAEDDVGFYVTADHEQFELSELTRNGRLRWAESDLSFVRDPADHRAYVIRVDDSVALEVLKEVGVSKELQQLVGTALHPPGEVSARLQAFVANLPSFPQLGGAEADVGDRSRSGAKFPSVQFAFMAAGVGERVEHGPVDHEHDRSWTAVPRRPFNELRRLLLLGAILVAAAVFIVLVLKWVGKPLTNAGWSETFLADLEVTPQLPAQLAAALQSWNVETAAMPLADRVPQLHRQCERLLNWVAEKQRKTPVPILERLLGLCTGWQRLLELQLASSDGATSVDKIGDQPAAVFEHLVQDMIGDLNQTNGTDSTNSEQSTGPLN